MDNKFGHDSNNQANFLNIKSTSDVARLVQPLGCGWPNWSGGDPVLKFGGQIYFQGCPAVNTLPVSSESQWLT